MGKNLCTLLKRIWRKSEKKCGKQSANSFTWISLSRFLQNSNYSINFCVSCITFYPGFTKKNLTNRENFHVHSNCGTNFLCTYVHEIHQVLNSFISRLSVLDFTYICQEIWKLQVETQESSICKARTSMRRFALVTQWLNNLFL